MTSNVHQGCGGTWQPCPGWYSRYRCDGCFALGLRERLVTAERSPNGELSSYGKESIRPYLCAKRVSRRPCGRAATRRVNRVCYCQEHAPT